MNARQRRRGRLAWRAWCLKGLALAVLGAAGCAGFWDEVTSRNFRPKNLFVKTDPLVVLRDSQDGNARAKALRSLREPRRHGGTQEEQDAVVNVLAAAASNERQAFCRLAAIQSLGRFQDPRAVQGLTAAFENARTFPAETRTVVRCEALKALGETRNPAALQLLVRVVREPRVEETEPFTDRLQALDVRVAAARALGHFSQREAHEALVSVLRTEKDVALRDRAHESLQQATGKKLPADEKAWNDYLQQAGAEGKDAGSGPGLFQLLSFWQRK